MSAPALPSATARRPVNPAAAEAGYTTVSRARATPPELASSSERRSSVPTNPSSGPATAAIPKA